MDYAKKPEDDTAPLPEWTEPAVQQICVRETAQQPFNGNDGGNGGALQDDTAS